MKGCFMIGLVMFLLSVGLVSGANTDLQGNLSGRGIYRIYNVTTFNGVNLSSLDSNVSALQVLFYGLYDNVSLLQLFQSGIYVNVTLNQNNILTNSSRLFVEIIDRQSNDSYLSNTISGVNMSVVGNASKLSVEILDRGTNDTALGARIDSVNGTAVGKASPGACSAGYAVMNTTTSGVQCVSIASADTNDTVALALEILNRQTNDTALYNNVTINRNDISTNASRLSAEILNRQSNDSYLSTQFYNSSEDAVFASVNSTGIIYANSNISFLNSSGSIINYIYSTDSGSTLQTLGTFNIGGSMFVSSNIGGANDIYTTGSGDDLWLGTATQSNANFRAYANGTIIGVMHYSNVTNAPWSLPGTCSGNQVVQNTTTSGVQCVTVVSSDTNNYTTGISVTGTTSKTLQLSRSGMANLSASWTDLTNTTGEVLSAASVYNDTVIVNLEISGRQGNDTALGSRIDSVNSTSVNKASPGNCPSGQVVMNTTTSGVQCVSVASGDTYNTTEEMIAAIDLSSARLNRSNIVNNWVFCPSGSVQYGENETGRYCDATFVNTTDLNNLFNQDLNTTSNVTFLNITTKKISITNDSGSIVGSLSYGSDNNYIYTSGNFYVSGILSSSTQLNTNGDIFTTGAGDDLWLGTSTQANALLKAYADGSLYSMNASIGNTTGTLGGNDNLIKCGSTSCFFNIKGGSGLGKMAIGNDDVYVIAGTGGALKFNYGATSSTNTGSTAVTVNNTGVFMGTRVYLNTSSTYQYSNGSCIFTITPTANFTVGC